MICKMEPFIKSKIRKTNGLIIMPWILYFLPPADLPKICILVIFESLSYPIPSS